MSLSSLYCTESKPSCCANCATGSGLTPFSWMCAFGSCFFLGLLAVFEVLTFDGLLFLFPSAVIGRVCEAKFWLVAKTGACKSVPPRWTKFCTKCWFPRSCCFWNSWLTNCVCSLFKKVSKSRLSRLPKQFKVSLFAKIAAAAACWFAIAFEPTTWLFNWGRRFCLVCCLSFSWNSLNS